MKNPYIFWTVFIVIFIGAFFLGNSTWAHNLTRRKNNNNGNGNGGNGGNNGSGTQPPAEGSSCKLPDGTAGIIKNGVCTTVGRPTDDNASERTSNMNSEKSSSASNLPNLILVPYTADCRAKYTQATPYSYGGCSYVFKQNIKQAGIAYCQLEKVSCP